MIESLLIANRGEIARRIIRTARRLGVRTIAVYSTADAFAPFVREADSAVAMGAAPAHDSYLRADKLLEAAAATGAAAIHPGYGFLSENAGFAESVLAAGLTWVGAPPAAIRAMGLKDTAKGLMQRAGVPVTPGYLGASQEPALLLREAAAIGYPVLIKAVAGGGGKGMRRVAAAGEFLDALAACRREAAAAFGDDRVLIERYVRTPRHIEVQVFGDSQGRIVHLFERDCSLQRRHQKVIEEAPAPGMSAETRDWLCAIAVKAAAAVGYVGAGTVEFIADASQGLRPDRIWFMEMNTRLQVEHPVTEAITGQDLVEWQLRVASGEPLPLAQQDLRIDGWAMEARLYAENPAAGFLPSTGVLDHWRLPGGVRVDSGFEEGSAVTGFYDPLLAKLVVHETNRPAAVRALAAACAAVQVWPVHTNAAFLARVAADAEFAAGEVDTGFIERRAQLLIPSAEPPSPVVDAAAAWLIDRSPGDPWSALVGFRANASRCGRVAVAVGVGVGVGVGGKIRHGVIDPEAIEAARSGEATCRVVCIEGQSVMFWRGQAWPFAVPRAADVLGAAPTADGTLRSPMPGRVVAVSVHTGQRVTQGQSLLALEAMKMEHALLAPFDGTVAELHVNVGDQVSENVTLARVVREA